MDIIFDIDGTLADCAHRRHHVEKTPKDWPAFKAAAHTDACIEVIARLARQAPLLANRVILCTGRDEEQREVTESWLAKHQIYYSALYMRTALDYRDDAIIKLELLARMREDGFNPVLAYDDRDRVVKAWRGAGLVCCQVAEGDF